MWARIKYAMINWAKLKYVMVNLLNKISHAPFDGPARWNTLRQIEKPNTKHFGRGQNFEVGEINEQIADCFEKRLKLLRFW